MEQARQFLSTLHGVDVLIALVVATYAVRGYSRGLLNEVLSLVGLLGGLAAAFRWTPDAVARFGEAIPGSGMTDTGIAFLAVFGIAGMALRILARAVERMSTPIGASPLNRLGGAVFGVCKGGVVLGCAVLILRTFVPAVTVAEAQAKDAGPIQAISGSLASAPLARHVTDWTSKLLSTFANAAELQLKVLAASGAEQR